MKTKISDLRGIIAAQAAEIEKLRQQAGGTADTGEIVTPGLTYSITRAGQDAPGVDDEVRVCLKIVRTDHTWETRWTTGRGLGYGIYRTHRSGKTWASAFAAAHAVVDPMIAEYACLCAARAEALRQA